MSLTVLYSIDRTSLSLAALDLTTANGYRVMPGTGPGGTTWAKGYARSPFTAPVLTSAVAETETLRLVVRCIDTTMAGMRTKVATLRTALGQFSYTITETLGGVATAYACDPADSRIGDAGSWRVADLRQFAQIVTADVPRNPNPTSGSL